MSFAVEPIRWLILCGDCGEYPDGIAGYIERSMTGCRGYTPDAGDTWFDTMDEARQWLIDRHRRIHSLRPAACGDEAQS